MKKVVRALVLTLAMSSPAFAATHHVRMPANGTAAYAAADSAITTDPNAVVFDNKVIGSDPDANVRLEIRRELPGYAD
jgi:hypothetical protein